MLKVVSGGELIAIAVLRAKFIFGIRCGILLEFCTTNHSLKNLATKELFTVIRALAWRNKLDLLMVAMQKSSDESLLLKMQGFFKVPGKFLPQRPEFILRIHRDFPGSELLKNFQKWFLTFGDYDIF